MIRHFHVHRVRLPDLVHMVLWYYERELCASTKRALRFFFWLGAGVLIIGALSALGMLVVAGAHAPKDSAAYRELNYAFSLVLLTNVLGIPILYIGYGTAMNAHKAEKEINFSSARKETTIHVSQHFLQPKVTLDVASVFDTYLSAAADVYPGAVDGDPVPAPHVDDAFGHLRDLVDTEAGPSCMYQGQVVQGDNLVGRGGWATGKDREVPRACAHPQRR